ncbi:Hypothetical_protein [Hexamita inflata]|uniref:Hypothetical_protein n=1 Tax=Hexamita inflata TaxID=28002 RepID=A0AA86NF47_9EUKA|nr:Hypothetical protein HINF_LOCUS5648 [Hexamita inflata]CAI9969644.1 Hypothetical protein HINF_LOCUS57289 [Hexamita inflata]
MRRTIQPLTKRSPLTNTPRLKLCQQSQPEKLCVRPMVFVPITRATKIQRIESLSQHNMSFSFDLNDDLKNEIRSHQVSFDRSIIDTLQQKINELKFTANQIDEFVIWANQIVNEMDTLQAKQMTLISEFKGM